MSDAGLPACPGRLLRAAQWHTLATKRWPELVRTLERVYGPGSSAVGPRLRRLADMAERFLGSFGDAPVAVARAPGRVNLMGRHVDHQGGHCNMLALEHDIYVMAAASDDGLLRARNVEPERFPDADAALNGLLDGYRGDWQAFVCSDEVVERSRRAAGAWHYYLEAALARIHADRPERACRGLRVVAAGDVPPAAGLSSSSALVVATVEALCRLYGLPADPEWLVTVTSEAEWYVGTRGGAGDQAAMKFALRDHVVQLSFLPLRRVKAAPWPSDCVLLVADSRESARKSGGARNTFNQRVACYHIGREMLLRANPHLRSRVEHLRDLTPHRLGVSAAEVASMLLQLPEALPRDAIPSLIGEELAHRLLVTHDCGDMPYPVRGVVLFGLAECERSRLCADLLEQGDLEGVGRLMQVSHDGDRVSSTRRPWDWPSGIPYGDAEIRALAERCRNGCGLESEPGTYACSTPSLDCMVDAVLGVEGVLGAQLCGAGLGGCMMALVRADCFEAARDALIRNYYEPRGLEPAVLLCRPATGSGPLEP